MILNMIPEAGNYNGTATKQKSDEESGDYWYIRESVKELNFGMEQRIERGGYGIKSLPRFAVVESKKGDMYTAYAAMCRSRMCYTIRNGQFCISLERV